MRKRPSHREFVDPARIDELLGNGHAEVRTLSLPPPAQLRRVIYPYHLVAQTTEGLAQMLRDATAEDGRYEYNSPERLRQHFRPAVGALLIVYGLGRRSSDRMFYGSWSVHMRTPQARHDHDNYDPPVLAEDTGALVRACFSRAQHHTLNILD